MKSTSKKNLTKAGWLLFYLYIIILFYNLFISEHYGREITFQNYRYNLEFFKEIKRFIINRQKLGFEAFITNIYGNVVAFIPLTFMLPLLDKKYRRFFYTVFICMLLSLCAELVQLYMKIGVFDVDDVMMNTLGGVLGYLCYLVFSAFLKLFHRKKKKR